MPAELTQAQHHQVMLKARDVGLIEMTYEGDWKLTRDGRDFLDMFDALRSLDDRAGADRPSSPLAGGSERSASRHGGAPGGAGRGDGRSTRRGARGKTSK